ncbi:MAG: HlyC/CorC family transporter [Deltaproteobacteria bacterium]|nr:HlyC/CorC family transporter [Deltaproteobacteria bacterium]
MSVGLLVIIIVVCVLFEGFFSGSEMAIVNADKFRLATSTVKGSRWALTVLHLVKRPSRFFSTTLLGTNVATVTGSVVTTLFIIDRFGPEKTLYAMLFWPVTLIFGELVPKSLCQYYANRLVAIVAPVVLVLSFLFYPVVWILSKCTDFLLSGLQRRFGREPLLTRDELELILRMDEGGDVKPFERRIVSRILGLSEKRVEQIKTPLVDMVALPVGASREEAVRLMEEQGFSRIPVYERRVFNIVGVLNGVDLLMGDAEKSVRDLMRPATFVPGQMRLDRLLADMRKRNVQLAVVVDEYGAATGVVSLEDVLEEVVGEIRDEHDVTPNLYERLGPKHYRIKGRMEILKVNEELHLGLPTGAYDTVSGFVLSLSKRIPAVGEIFRIKGLTITILKATDRVIEEVEIEVKN